MVPFNGTWKDHKAPKPHVSPNHSSVMIHAKQLGHKLDEAEQMGMAERYDPTCHGSKQDFACNVIGARVKPSGAMPSGAIKMLVDPRLPGITEAMIELLPCTLPTVKHIFQLVKPTSVLGIHCTSSVKARRYLMGYQLPITKWPHQSGAPVGAAPPTRSQLRHQRRTQTPVQNSHNGCHQPTLDPLLANVCQASPFRLAMC